MDTITTALFEDPVWIYIALAAVLAALVALWRVRPRRLTAVAMIVPVAFAAAVFVVSSRTVTDREKIASACRAIADDIRAGNTDVLAEYLDGDYRGFCGTRRRAVKVCEATIARYGLRVLTLRRLEVQPDGLNAEMQATTLIVAARSHAAGRPVQLNWNVRWAKRPQGWRIVEAAMVRR